jgi:hypothetical protein
MLSLAFDGVLQAESLALAWEALRSCYRSRDGISVEWENANGHRERRLLGALTSLSLKQARLTSFEVACKDLIRRLDEVRWFAGKERKLADPIRRILDAVTDRLMTALPGDLFAHVRMDQLLTAVPRSCLARRDSQQALQWEVMKGDESSLARRVRFMMADRLSAQLRGDPMADADLLKGIRSACAVPSITQNKAKQRALMASQLHGLQPLAHEASSGIALFWTWAINLVEEGTEHTSPLAPNSIEDYVGSVFDLLPAALRSLLDTGSSFAELPWRDTMQSLLNSPDIPQSQIAKVEAALESFLFMLTRFGIPQEGKLRGTSQPRAARGNVVWPHEVEWLLDQLRQRDISQRYHHQLLVVFALLADESCALRTQDLGHIHVGGMPLDADGKLLLIDPLPNAGSGKTLPARRHVEPQQQITQSLLAGWRRRRAVENATNEALLFADPSDPSRVYVKVRMEMELNALLKAATGDPSVSIHTLRHSALSYARHDALARGPYAFEESSAQAGHADPITTLTSYMHLYEVPLRLALDGMWRRHALTESAVCGLTHLKPGVLRQRWHRHREASKDSLAWLAIEEAAAAVQVPHVCAGVALQQAVMPAAVERQVRGPQRITEALACLAAGEDDMAVRMRFDFADDEWSALERALHVWQATQRRQSRRLNVRRRNKEDGRIPFRKGFARLGQPKLKLLADELARTSDEASLRPAVDAWEEALVFEWISAEDALALLPWLQWLKNARLSAKQLVVCAAESGTSSGNDASDWIHDIFGEPPTVRTVCSRGGRPRAYLMLTECGETRADSTSNAALSVDGLNALMVSAWC